MREIGDNEQSPAAEIDPWPTQQHPSWLGEPTPGYQAPGEQGEIGADHPRQQHAESAHSELSVIEPVPGELVTIEPSVAELGYVDHPDAEPAPADRSQAEPVQAEVVQAEPVRDGSGRFTSVLAAESDEDWLADTPYAGSNDWAADAQHAPVAVDAAIAVAMANARAHGSAEPSGDPAAPISPAVPPALGVASVRPAAMPMDPEQDQFRVPVQEVPRERWIPAELHGGHAPWAQAPPVRPRRKPRSPRRLAVALPLMLVFGLLAAFFSWVSAEPLWLAVGHGTEGAATVTRCVGGGASQRCLGDFIAHDATFTAAGITLSGVTDPTVGKILDAQMVNAKSHRAYSASLGALHLWWLIGLALVLLCGAAIALTSGALRLPDRGERLAAISASFAAPLLLTVGFLAAAF